MEMKENEQTEDEQSLTFVGLKELQDEWMAECMRDMRKDVLIQAKKSFCKRQGTDFFRNGGDRPAEHVFRETWIDISGNG